MISTKEYRVVLIGAYPEGTRPDQCQGHYVDADSREAAIAKVHARSAGLSDFVTLATLWKVNRRSVPAQPYAGSDAAVTLLTGGSESI